MFTFKWKHLGITAMLFLTLLLAACGNDDSTKDNEDATNTTGVELGQKDIELVYVEWDTEVASTHVVAEVLKDQGYNVKVTPIDNALMWKSVAEGEADGMVAAWLPATHGDLYEQFKDQLVDLGTNLEGAKIGLVVPSYMDITSVSDLANIKEELNGKITGIEAGAGVVKASQAAIEDYELDGFEVQTSSSGAMAAALGEAIEDEEPIVVTGWSPHWKFAKYDLKYLEDPKGTFGGEETINTMVRQGLEEDAPLAYQILDNFHWDAADIEAVMLEINNGEDPEKIARNWVDNNKEKVQEWIPAE
jgi:glycine betaine/proline transport system substrate-binding protein